MGEIVNLRLARKAQQRSRKEAKAAANRLAHGTAKHMRKAAAVEKQRAERTIDAHKIETKARD